MRKLRDYLYHNDISQTDFAKRLGITKTTMNLIVHGHRRPNNNTIQKIADLTGWEVEPNDFYERPK